jgi:hypothetical protein
VLSGAALQEDVQIAALNCLAVAAGVGRAFRYHQVL